MKAWVIAVLGMQLLISSAFADGCFVFRWDKKTDINEPTQKAVILHDGGREDLLLQVKYEGAVDDFGWLIPVPSLPTVGQGSMDAFYELSRLTQLVFGNGTNRPMTLFGGPEGRAPRVKVIETKTVGAYQVSILAADDAGSLERWLKENGYSIPGGKSEREIVEDYIRRRWFFVAAKINLHGSGFNLVSSKAQGALTPAQAKSALQKKLASGELHPLLISFDTPRCVFPLKISSVGGKPSEVSLYVISEKPLLNRFIFDDGCTKLQAKWEKAITPAEYHRRNWENMRMMEMATMLYSADGVNAPRGWTVEDLQATIRETRVTPLEPSLDEKFSAPSGKLLQCMVVDQEDTARAAKSIPRLKKKRWYLTKLTRTFSASEMRDLEFEPAIPVVAEVLAKPIGKTAASLLAQLGADGAAALIGGCESNDTNVRKNSAWGLQSVRNSRVVEALLPLLHDNSPAVRLHAVEAAENNWGRRFVEPMIGLFCDPHPEVRSAATGTLEKHETRDDAPKYVTKTTDPDENVRMCAIAVTARLNPDAVPREPLRELLKSPNPVAQWTALITISMMNRNDLASRAELLEILNSPRMDNINMALSLIYRQSRDGVGAKAGVVSREITRSLTSSEAAVLATNRFAEARLAGLRALRGNADTRAMESTLPLLRDSNAIVRTRAFAAMKAMTGESISDDDASKWEKWWQMNKGALRDPAVGP